MKSKVIYDKEKLPNRMDRHFVLICKMSVAMCKVQGSLCKGLASFNQQQSQPPPSIKKSKLYDLIPLPLKN
jgi:hypothetical protein